jgi:hypothetical protein
MTPFVTAHRTEMVEQEQDQEPEKFAKFVQEPEGDANA